MLNDILREQWEYAMRTQPIYTSILGNKRYNDKVDDFSQEAIDNDIQEIRRFLVRFEDRVWPENSGLRPSDSAFACSKQTAIAP